MAEKTIDLVSSYIPSLAGLERAVAVIVVSEIGDKTFLIAAILAMRHSRLIVFVGAISALALMSLLSALLGHILPTLLPRRYTTIVAAALFFVFGAKMLQEGLAMEPGTGQIEEEMMEVQREVEQAAAETEASAVSTNRSSSPNRARNVPLEDLEEGRLVEPNPKVLTISSRPTSPQISRPGTPVSATLPHKRRRSSATKHPVIIGARDTLADGARNLCQLCFSPMLVQSFILTFLAEWGDRSQITTIALAAAHNVWLVTLGTILGHSICTCGAVLGGRWLATKISVRNVTLGGSALFLIFGCVYAWEAYAWEEDSLKTTSPSGP